MIKLSLFAVSALALVACNVAVVDAETPGIEPDPDAAPVATAPGGAATSEPAMPNLGKVCTQMGCIDGFGVEVEGKFGNGKYEVSIEADGKKSTCEISLPLAACDKGHSTTCKGDVEVMIGESGCALPADQQAFGPLSLKGAPTAVKVAIKRAGREIGAGEYKPTYQTVQPNGPDCQPTCKNAREKLIIK